MGQIILIPKNAVICIIGTSCTGKTTLSRRILESVPSDSAILVSADEVFKERFGFVPAEVAENAALVEIHGGLDAISHSYGQVIGDRLLDSLHQPGMMIYDFAPNNTTEVTNFLMAASMVRQMPSVVLIKMSPKKKIYQEFYKKRQAQGTCFPTWTMEATRPALQQIVDFRYHNIYPWIDEYLVNDPRAVELEFK